MIKRIIPKIGQGCCVEQIAYMNCEKYRILYDCGSDNRNLLKGYIDTLDAKVQTTLVISHLHKDHINEVQYLIEHFKKKKEKIKRLFLPAYHPDMIVIFAASILAASTNETLKNDMDLIKFIYNLYSFEKNKDFEEIYFVLSSNSAESNDQSTGRIISEIKNHYKERLVYDEEFQGITDFPNDINWVVKFWVDPNIYSLLPQECSEQLKNITLSDFANEEKQNEIKKIYDNLIKTNDFNLTSMIMASYLTTNGGPLILGPFPFLFCRLHDFLSSGFVCTGDYPFKKKEIGKDIHKHYLEEQTLIFEMMLPHHGSGNNYCKFIPFDFIKKAYAQNGKDNKHKHPNRQVIEFLEELGIEFVNVQNP